MTVGEKIKNARKSKGLTQEDLGRKLGIKQQTVAMFENDKTNIKYSTIEKIAAALNISPAYLMPESIINMIKNKE